ncbi:hypothetical protein LHJ74_14405 [Streptomyces sp. N2-109]|uniref:XRE family transcriptional regulator n=1 Tax=Streptomyces gossypii TaxID=2883101 RepID=A0ABT2JUQ1_9ACTN|nr:hypothetical protein [Streptomyces gossypii]MCT2591085.1 hypothetical protein [Streptomyces gossypii]
MAEQEKPTERTQLADLVRSRKAEIGLSYDRLAARCIDPGTGEQTVKYSWLHRLASGQPVIPPQLPQLNGLAVGLDVDLGVVQDAAGAQFLGIDTVWSQSGEARAWVRNAERLTPDQRAAVERLINTFTEGQ